LRNMWEFASLNQYIYAFGDAVKIDKDLDIEVYFYRFLHIPMVRPRSPAELF
jgi:hypothetical protein